MNELMPLLSPQEQAFFTNLDQELEKIESFYLDREKEMSARTHALGEQISELSIQRKRFHVMFFMNRIALVVNSFSGF